MGNQDITCRNKFGLLHSICGPVVSLLCIGSHTMLEVDATQQNIFKQSTKNDF